MPMTSRITCACVFMLPLLMPKARAERSAPVAERTSGAVQPPSISTASMSNWLMYDSSAVVSDAAKRSCRSSAEAEVTLAIETRVVIPATATSGKSWKELERRLWPKVFAGMPSAGNP